MRPLTPPKKGSIKFSFDLRLIFFNNALVWKPIEMHIMRTEFTMKTITCSPIITRFWFNERINHVRNELGENKI